MYYAHFILSKKGPLAKIWLAAHWDKKLTKAQIYETNIESTIETILEPKMKLALRTSGHLLLGVCRIYSRKVKYLLADCNEAFVKIKMAFRPGLIDLPKEKQQASVDAITLQEKFPEIDINFVDINMDDMDLSKNIMTQQARIEDITLKEDYGHMIIQQDDDFGDMGFAMNSLLMNDFNDDREAFRDNPMQMDDNFDQTTTNILNDRNATDLRDNERMDINDDINISERMPNLDIHDDTFTYNDLGLNGSRSEAPAIVPALFEEQPTINKTTDEPLSKIARLEEADDEESKKTEAAAASTTDDQQNEKENNELAAIAQVPVVTEKRTRRRRNKLIVDDVKEIDSVTMKAQLNDTSSIIGSLELAPPTRKLMSLKESGCIEKLFNSTSRTINCKQLQKLYTRNMVTKKHAEMLVKNKENIEQSFVNFVEADMSTYSMQEKQRDQQNATTDNLLPLADSFVDNNVDSSKQRVDITLDNQTIIGEAADQTITDNNEINNPTTDVPVAGAQEGLANENTLIDDMDMMPQAPLELTPPQQQANSEKHKTNKSHQRKSTTANTTTTAIKDTSDLLDDITNNQTDNDGNDHSKTLNKRAKTMVSILNKSFTKHANVGFFELTKRNGRKQVAQKFYSLLVLKKYSLIDVTQAETYGDIIITKGETFDNYAAC